MYAQTCTALGQNPETAFPVCGTDPFHQVTVPYCGERSVPAPSCPNGPFPDKNPFWYKFTCYAGGTLGFTIAPNNVGQEDYDWELFDVTGVSVDQVFSNASLIVAYDWSAEFQITGTDDTKGTKLRECDGPGVNTYTRMPILVTGHNYLLLVSHFSNTPNGYTLSFGGGTAVITDPKEPHLEEATAICDGTSAWIKLNKKMKCSSLLANGSEFSITPHVANVIGAVGVNCSNSFDMDSIRLTFDTPLAPGNYFINIRKGTDGNTLLDNCDREIPNGEKIPMIVYPLVPTPMDSVIKPGCAPDVLRLVFRKTIKCNSIAPDGSDFIVTGTTPVTVTGASGVCNGDGLSKYIDVKLSAPIQTKGNYRITLQTGTDRNTIIDECSQETPAGAFVDFVTKDTVNADFTYNIIIGCERDTINYFHDGRNEVNSWKWNFDKLRTSRLQNPSILYASFGQKLTQLIVSNGVCTDTSAWVPILLDNELKSVFEATSFVCPNDQAVFIDKSIGKGLSWYWDFANGNSSTLQQPLPQSYLPSNTTRDVIPQLIVTDSYGCKDTSYQKITVPNHCYIAVPNAFTPNGDGVNDMLYPINAYKASKLLFRIYNRFGQLLYETTDWTRGWNGKYKGQGADPGTYVWTLHYITTDTGKTIDQKGTSILIR
jgi:gliding motility-associated-like protein